MFLNLFISLSDIHWALLCAHYCALQSLTVLCKMGICLLLRVLHIIQASYSMSMIMNSSKCCKYRRQWESMLQGAEPSSQIEYSTVRTEAMLLVSRGWRKWYVKSGEVEVDQAALQSNLQVRSCKQKSGLMRSAFWKDWLAAGGDWFGKEFRRWLSSMESWWS